MLKLTELENAVWCATVHMLGLDPDNPATQDRVRISWPTYNESGSAPGWSREEDVCFFRAAPKDDPISRQRDTGYRPADGVSAIFSTSYIRVHEVAWIFYGPNSCDDAETVRLMLLHPDVRYMLARSGLYPVPNFAAPKRAPELIEGAWWERADFTAAFHEAVRVESEVGLIESVPVHVPGSETDGDAGDSASGIHILTETEDRIIDTLS